MLRPSPSHGTQRLPNDDDDHDDDDDDDDGGDDDDDDDDPQSVMPLLSLRFSRIAVSLPVCFQCSARCGIGLQKRRVYCQKRRNGNRYRCPSKHPAGVRYCHAPPCQGTSTFLDKLALINELYTTNDKAFSSSFLSIFFYLQ